MNLAVRLIGAVPLTLVALLAAGALIHDGVPTHAPPIVRMQRVETVDQLAAYVGDKGTKERAMERHRLYADFGFIAFYLAFFITLAVLLAKRDPAWATWLAVCASLTAAAAAINDVVENLATLKVLRTPLSGTTQAMIDSMRTATSAKFTLIAITLCLLSALFSGARPRIVTAFAVLWPAVALLGLIAVWWLPLLPAFFLIDLGVLFATCVLFAVSPSTFLTGY